MMLVSFLLMFGCKISGTVTDNGVGVTDVYVGIGGSIFVTGDDGNYTSKNLLPLQYTVTPSKEGYTFEPESQSVNFIDFIIGKANSVDFVASGETGLTWDEGNWNELNWN